MKTTEKVYYLQFRIGKAKYVVNYYDGKAKHKDGSKFYGIYIFKNKKDLGNCIENLRKQGYKERGIVLNNPQ